ncbi:phosphatidylinositide phosphatase SAC2-like [Polyodon spathula]|uniref:phosphatidylinositide phosphatase SAC2-like n=1 Tax=Polyodon spathula TaxID=7913 RepID=UPI001B7F0A4F|nr:phosphatidylinositide phosphatase SAC2-like [Polyodon spathula]
MRTAETPRRRAKSWDPEVKEGRGRTLHNKYHKTDEGSRETRKRGKGGPGAQRSRLSRECTKGGGLQKRAEVPTKETSKKRDNAEHSEWGYEEEFTLRVRRRKARKSLSGPSEVKRDNEGRARGTETKEKAAVAGVGDNTTKATREILQYTNTERRPCGLGTVHHHAQGRPGKWRCREKLKVQRRTTTGPEDLGNLVAGFYKSLFILASWPSFQSEDLNHLIDATHKDVDVLLLLSNCAYYVAYYDDEADKVNQYQRLSLENLEKIEIGPEPTFFGKPKFSCMRLHYKHQETSGYFHTLRAVPRSPEEDGKDTLQCIAEMLRITKQAMELDVAIVEKKLERKHSKPHEDIISIRTKNSKGQVLGSTGLAQGKNFLLNKFSSLNQKVKQTKSNVNIGSFKPLGKLGNFSKPEMKVNFLKPNLKVNLWKSDSSLETSDSTVAGALKDHSESDLEISSDSDSFHSNEFLPNEDEDRQLAGSLENFDYVLPSCGIVAAAPRLGSRTQSITSTDISGTPAPPSMICITDCDRNPEKQPENNGKSYEHPTPSEEAVLIDFGTPIDAYCHQFVQDAQSKDPSMEELGFNQPLPDSGHSRSNPPGDVEGQLEQRDQQLSRPSQLDVATSLEANLLSVQPASSAASSSSQKSLGSQLQASTGPSPVEGNGSRVASPFAKIRSSMVQVASMTQAGLTQGINFAVAKVQKSPEPESINEAQQSDLKAMFTQCQTRIIQI